MNSKYVVPWNQLRSMWIAYFGLQEEFPELVDIKEIRKSLRDCIHYANNAAVNVDEITEWRARFERWISQAESLTHTDNDESGIIYSHSEFYCLTLLYQMLALKKFIC